MGHSEGARFLWIRIVIPLTLDTYPHVLPGLGDAAAGEMDEALGWFGCSTLGPKYPWRRIPYSSLSGGISSRSSVRAFKACRSLTPRPSNPHLDKQALTPPCYLHRGLQPILDTVSATVTLFDPKAMRRRMRYLGVLTAPLRSVRQPDKNLARGFETS